MGGVAEKRRRLLVVHPAAYPVQCYETTSNFRPRYGVVSGVPFHQTIGD